MPTEKENIDSWEACPAGELSKMVHRVDARQRGARRMQVIKTTLVSTGVFACVVLALGLFVNPKSNYGNISCSYCRGHMAEYAPHASGELVHEDATFVTNMKTHLEKCTFCRGDFNELYPELEITAATATQLEFAFGYQPLFAICHPEAFY